MRGGWARAGSGLGGDEAIADAWLGDEEAGMGGVRLELAAQADEVDAQVVGFVAVAVAPDTLQEQAVRQHFARIGNQLGQQGELGGGEADLGAVLADDVGVEVDLQGAVATGTGGLRLRVGDPARAAQGGAPVSLAGRGSRMTSPPLTPASGSAAVRRRGNSWLYPLGIGLGLAPVALLIAFGFTQCRLVAMCDTTNNTRARRELGTRHSVSD